MNENLCPQCGDQMDSIYEGGTLLCWTCDNLGEKIATEATNCAVLEAETEHEWRQVIAALRAKKVAFVPDEIQELWLDQYEYEASQELLNQL